MPGWRTTALVIALADSVLAQRQFRPPPPAPMPPVTTPQAPPPPPSPPHCPRWCRWLGMDQVYCYVGACDGCDFCHIPPSPPKSPSPLPPPPAPPNVPAAPGDVRLCKVPGDLGGSMYGDPSNEVCSSANDEGRVEIYHDGEWGTVCDDYWGIDEARAVCHQLGFRDALYHWTGAWFGRGSEEKPIWMDDVSCSRQAMRLDQCTFSQGWGVSNCFHDEDAAVSCDPMSDPPHPPILFAQSRVH